MAKRIVIILMYYHTISTCFGARLPFESYNGSDAGTCSKPLILTPYIESGKIEKAQKLARVSLPDNVYEMISYSGYLTVNKSCNSNLFFWYFPSQNGEDRAPLTLWLQGGPGGSSLYGMFQEIGPFTVTDEDKVLKRNQTWNSISSLLFIDQPVGTGYSFTEIEDCMATNEDDVRKDLYTALVQFFKLFPKLQKNDFYIFGESYAGKFIPAIAFSIHENNPKAEIRINLKGLGIGDGFTDPKNMMVYSDYVYQLGLVDETGKKEIHDREEKAIRSIENGDWARALMFGLSIHMRIQQSHVSLYDYTTSSSELSKPYEKYVTNNLIRCAIHVGRVPYDDPSILVFNKLDLEFMKSTKSWVEVLVENYAILFYNGQFDIIVGYPLTRNFINTMSWSGSEEFKKSKRSQFFDVSGKHCGYIKGYKKLNLALVRNAGHMVPADQPECAYQLFKSFIFDRNNVVPEIFGDIV